jgi:glycosyltransferase involved in cell wall biosynthesis
MAAELGIKDRVIFTGFREDATAVMSIFDLFVLSSLHEGLPVALLEAMSRGKPAVCTAVGGVPEVIEDGVNGFLVSPKNPPELAEKVLCVLGDDALRLSMSRKAMETVQDRFSIKAMVKRVEEVYSTVLAG